MKILDMRAKCRICEDYRVVNYADGSSSIGCMAESSNDYPVDIRNMTSCPRGHSCKRREIDRQALMRVIGRIYSLSSVSPAVLPLYKMVSSERAIAGKRTLIGQAILQLGIIERVSCRMQGHRGVCCSYRWSAGPPSLEMCEAIVKKTDELLYDMVMARSKSRKSDKPVQPRLPKIDKSMRGTTSCIRCRFKDVQNCRERLLALGYDCKSINVNRLPDEVTVGLTTQDR